jgi:hypothetical protein
MFQLALKSSFSLAVGLLVATRDVPV